MENSVLPILLLFVPIVLVGAKLHSDYIDYELAKEGVDQLSQIWQPARHINELYTHPSRSTDSQRDAERLVSSSDGSRTMDITSALRSASRHIRSLQDTDEKQDINDYFFDDPPTYNIREDEEEGNEEKATFATIALAKSSSRRNNIRDGKKGDRKGNVGRVTSGGRQQQQLTRRPMLGGVEYRQMLLEAILEQLRQAQGAQVLRDVLHSAAPKKRTSSDIWGDVTRTEKHDDAWGIIEPAPENNPPLHFDKKSHNESYGFHYSADKHLGYAELGEEMDGRTDIDFINDTSGLQGGDEKENNAADYGNSVTITRSGSDGARPAVPMAVRGHTGYYDDYNVNDDSIWQEGQWRAGPDDAGVTMPELEELLISAHSLGLHEEQEQGVLCLQGDCDDTVPLDGDEGGVKQQSDDKSVELESTKGEREEAVPMPTTAPASGGRLVTGFVAGSDSTGRLTSHHDNYPILRALIETSSTSTAQPPPHYQHRETSGSELLTITDKRHYSPQPPAALGETLSADSAAAALLAQTTMSGQQLTDKPEGKRGDRPKTNYGSSERPGKDRKWKGRLGVLGRFPITPGHHHYQGYGDESMHTLPPAYYSSKLPQITKVPTHHTSRHNKQKEHFIFGRDDRGRVSGYASRKYPYNNVVRMSNGCTGTLVTPKHVLTAAHCLHTGYRFKAAPSALKVLVPHTVMGPRVYYAKAFKVSRRWHKVYQLSNLHRAMYDYAVLELRTPVLGRRRFTGFDWYSNVFLHPISFIGFPSERVYGRQTYLLRSTCHVDLQAGSLLLNRCDSAKGTSGAAAVMAADRRRGVRIVGVVSAVISHAPSHLAAGREVTNNDTGGSGGPRGYNVITRLTLPKLWDVCDMLGTPWEKYVCSDYPLRKRPKHKAGRYLYING